MRYIIGLIGTLLITFVFSGCSLFKDSPYKDSKTGVMIYEIDKKTASQLTYKSISHIFPKLKVQRKDNTYFVDYKLMNDKQRYTIKLVKVQGTLNKELIKGFSFDIFSEGTMWISYDKRKEFLEYALSQFNNTGRGIIVQNSTRIKMSKDVVQKRQPRTNYALQKKEKIVYPLYSKEKNKPEASPIAKVVPTDKKVKPKYVQVKQPYVKEKTYAKPTIESKLIRAKNMYNNGLINDKEYYNMRKKLLIQNQ